MKIRPIRVELWRNGECIEEAAIAPDGTFSRPLTCRKGDVLYPIWEYSDAPIFVGRKATLRRNP